MPPDADRNQHNSESASSGPSLTWMFLGAIDQIYVATDPSAVATALIALGGALVGAVLSTGTQLFIAWRQGKREQATHKKQAAIAARMMAVDLARAESNIGYCVDHAEWWRTTGLAPRATSDDRRLVLGELTPEGFWVLDRAEGAIDHWYGIREYEVARNQGYTSLSITSQLDKLREIIGWIEDARATLRELTGDPASIESTPQSSAPSALDSGAPAVG
jgi:hypothetical protein